MEKTDDRDNQQIIAMKKMPLTTAIDPTPKIRKQFQQFFPSELEKLDKDITEVVLDLNGSNIVTFHNTFDYFAKDYGLNVIGVIENEHGKTPSAGEIATLVESIKENNVKAIFVEPEYSMKLVDTIAKETENKVYMLNPVTSGDDNKDEYLSIMRENLNVLKEALSQEGK